MPGIHQDWKLNRDIVWFAPGAVYGYCPKCGAAGEMREKTDGTGKDRCERKHVYPSAEAVKTRPTGGATPDVKTTHERRSVRKEKPRAVRKPAARRGGKEKPAKRKR